MQIGNNSIFRTRRKFYPKPSSSSSRRAVLSLFLVSMALFHVPALRAESASVASIPNTWSLSANAHAVVNGENLTISRNAGAAGQLAINRSIHLNAGQMLFLTLSVSAGQETKLHVTSNPADRSYPLGSDEEFAIHPLPTPVVAALPAAESGDFSIAITSDSPFTIQSLSTEVRQLDWLKDAAEPSLHAVNISALPQRWSNDTGRYLRALGGTVAFQFIPTWITALHGGRGGIFDAYVALSMTADKNNWTTYFMIQPPHTDAENVSWERSHWKLDIPLVIGDAPDHGWRPAVSRLDDGKEHFLAFTWQQFRLNDANYLYTSYQVDGKPYNACVTFLGDQSVAPDPKAIFLGSLGGQPEGYDPSPSAPIDVRRLLVYRDALSPQGVEALYRELQAGHTPPVTAMAETTAGPITDSQLSNRVVNGGFELGPAGWGGRFVDTIAGHPHNSWHGQPWTSIGSNLVWQPHSGIGNSAALVFALPRFDGKPLSGDAFVLPPRQRFRVAFWARADEPGSKMTLELRRRGASDPLLTTLTASPTAKWQQYSTIVETTGGDSNFYDVVVRAEGAAQNRVYLDDISVAGPHIAPFSRIAATPPEVAVQVRGRPDGIITDAAPAPLDIRFAWTHPAARMPLTVRVRVHDLFGSVFYDHSRKMVLGAAAGASVDHLAWSIPTRVMGLWRVRVDVTGQGGHSEAECPVTVVNHAIVSAATEPDSFWGGEWFPSDETTSVMQRLGMKWLKLMNVGTGYGFWNVVETTPGHFTYETTPELVRQNSFLQDMGVPTNFDERIAALHKAGVLGMMTLVGAPPWENTEQAEHPGGIHDAFPKDMAAWGRAVHNIVTHYRGKIPYYEIWNEPGWWDNNTHLRTTKTYKDYAVLVQTAIHAIRDADPSAKIVYQYYFNAMSGADHVLQRQILKQVDVISTHNYFNDLPPDEDGTEQFFADMQKEVAQSGNPHLQLWNSEGGIRAGGWHPYLAPETLPYPRPAPFESLRRGAQLAKAAILMQAYGYKKWFYYINAGPVGARADEDLADYSNGILAGSYGTPTVAGGMAAVYAGLLHKATYLKTITRNPRVRFFLFRTPQRALAFYWGKNFGRETGDLRLASASTPTILDMMGNPVPVQHAGGEWRLPLTNLIHILCAPTAADLERTINRMSLRALPGNDFDAVLAAPFKEKFDYATTLAGEQWYQVDLSRLCNMGFADEVAGDGKGGWTDEGPDNDLRYMPTGLLSLYGVPFRVVDPAQNNGRSCIVLRSGPGGPGIRTNRPPFPTSVTIPVGRKSNVFYFLIGVGWGTTLDVATLTIHYAGGAAAQVPLQDGVNVLNWHDAPLPNAVDHKFVPARKDRFLYAVQWINPHPTETIQSITFTSAGQTPIPILLSITGHGMG